MPEQPLREGKTKRGSKPPPTRPRPGGTPPSQIRPRKPLVIASGGVNPSNRGAGFPNLAGRVSVSDVTNESVQDRIFRTDVIARAELITAGIDATGCEMLRHKREVPTKYIGEIAGTGWGFTRAWYYWVAEGPGVPPEYARKLHASHGKECRVMGHCGAPDPIAYCKGFGVGLYHVDSPEGLKALADTIKTIRDQARKR